MKHLSATIKVSLFILIFMIIGVNQATAFSYDDIDNSDDTLLPPPRTSLGYPRIFDIILPTIGTQDEAEEQPILFPYNCQEPNPNCWVRMVYQNIDDMNWEIYLTNTFVHGSVYSRKVTNHGASDILPNLRISGDRIAFASNRDNTYDIYVMYTDIWKIKRLTFN